MKLLSLFFTVNDFLVLLADDKGERNGGVFGADAFEAGLADLTLGGFEVVDLIVDVNKILEGVTKKHVPRARAVVALEVVLVVLIILLEMLEVVVTEEVHASLKKNNYK